MSVKQVGILLTSRRFVPLLVAQLFGGFNDQFLKNALIALVTWGGMELWGLETKIAVPLAGLLFTAPFFFLSSLAGQFADKYDKALVLRRVKFVEIFIMLGAAGGLLLQSPTLLVTTLMAMGAQSAFFSPSRNSVLPQWLTNEELLSGNALMSGFLYVFIMIGQIMGTLLILQHGGAKIVSAGLILCALLGWLAMRQAPAAPSPNPDLKINYNIFVDTFKNLAFAFKHPSVLRPMLGTAWYYGLSAAVLIMMPAYISDILHYDAKVFLMVMVIFVIGAACGALVCTLFSKGRDAIGLSAIGALGLAVFTLDLFLNAGDNGRTAMGGISEFLAAPETPRFLIGLLGSAVFAAIFVVPMNTMSQRRADPAHRARLLAAGSILLNAATTLVQGLVVLMNVSPLPMQTPFIIICVVSTLIGIYAAKRALALRTES